MALELNKSEISSDRVKKVFEQRCQAHVGLTGKNPTAEQKERFKQDVVRLAKEINKNRGAK